MQLLTCFFLFFFNDTAPTEIYPLSLHDALPISGTADHRDDEVALLEPRHRRPDLDHLPQRLVADHEVLRAGRRGAVLEGADLAVGAAHADLEHAEPDRGGRREGRRFLLDQLDLALAGEDGDGPHARLLSGHTTFVRVRCDGAGAGFSPPILRGPGGYLYSVEDLGHRDAREPHRERGAERGLCQAGNKE